MIDGMNKINIWDIESFQQELDEVQDDWKSFGRKYAQLSDFIHFAVVTMQISSDDMGKLKSGKDKFDIIALIGD